MALINGDAHQLARLPHMHSGWQQVAAQALCHTVQDAHVKHLLMWHTNLQAAAAAQLGPACLSAGRLRPVA